MGYTTVAKVRERTGLVSDEIGDSELSSLIDKASIELNNQLNVKVEQEKVIYFGVSWKENTIDGSNKTFYTRCYPLGDADDDFSVGTADISVWTWNGTTKTSRTVSSIDDESGQFVLNTAPTGSEVLYLKYEWLTIPLSDAMIQKACTELSAYYAIKRLHGRGIKKYKIGTFSVDKGDTVGKDFLDEYERTLNQIRREKFVIVRGDDLLDLPRDGE